MTLAYFVEVNKEAQLDRLRKSEKQCWMMQVYVGCDKQNTWQNIKDRLSDITWCKLLAIQNSNVGAKLK